MENNFSESFFTPELVCFVQEMVKYTHPNFYASVDELYFTGNKDIVLYHCLRSFWQLKFE